MARRFPLIIAVLLIPFDFLMIIGAAFAAYFLRFEVGVINRFLPQGIVIPPEEFLRWVLLFALVSIIFFAIHGLYSFKIKRKFFEELGKIITACSAGMLVVILAMFFSLELFTSRFILLAVWILSIVFVLFGRLAVRILKFMFFSKGRGTENVVILGEGRNADVLASSIYKNPGSGYRILDRYKDFFEETKKKIEELHTISRVDTILAVNPDISRKELLEILEFADSQHITLKYSADFFTTRSPRLALETFFGVPLVEVKRTPLEGWGRIVKRIFDIAISLILIIITLPLMIVTAIAIKLDSRGPIFFSRLDDGSPLKRVGQYGKFFRYFKFRSMIPKSDTWRYTRLKHLDFRKGPLVKIRDDPRVTLVGRFIRKYSIDELPEIFLVLTGAMSLVGPRPHLPEEVAQYKREYRPIFLIKPGITGLSQISGRSDLDFDEEAKLDLFYIENWSFLLDLIILLKTPWVVLKGVVG